MNSFQKELKIVLRAEPFLDNQRALALFAGIDGGQLFRVVAGDRDPTPEFVGRLCGTLPAEPAAWLFQAYLMDIIAATSKADPGPPSSQEERRRLGAWHAPLSLLSLTINCEPKPAAARGR